MRTTGASLPSLHPSLAPTPRCASVLATLMPQVVCYDIEVVTGCQPGAGTTSKVYLELVGSGGSSGEHRLMYRQGSGRTAFVAGATDAFRLHCAPLGKLLKVRHWAEVAGARLEGAGGVGSGRQGADGSWGVAQKLVTSPAPKAFRRPYRLDALQHQCVVNPSIQSTPSPRRLPLSGACVPQQRGPAPRLAARGGARPGAGRGPLDRLPLRPLAGGAPG